MKQLTFKAAFLLSITASLFYIPKTDAQQLQTPTGLSGIGTSPSNHIISTGSTTNGGILKVQNTNGGPNDKWWIGFSHGTNINHTTDPYDRARIGVDILPGGAGRLFFTTGPHLSQTERMRIDEAGNIGIGTTAPSKRLHVNGTVEFDGLTSATYTSGYNLLGLDPLNEVVSMPFPGIIGTGTTNNLVKWTGAGTVGNSLFTEDATTVKLGNPSSATPWNFMYIRQSGASTQSTGINIELIGNAPGATGQGAAFNVQNNQVNIGLNSFAANGTDATAGQFTAQNASNDNIAFDGEASGGVSSTGGYFNAHDASSENIGVDAKALGSATENYGGRFETENASSHNYGVYATAEFGPRSTGAFLAGANSENTTGVIAGAIGNLSPGSLAKGGELTATNAKTSIGLVAAGTGSSGNTHNYGMQANADAFSRGGGTTVNYGIYSSALGGNDVGTNAGVYVKADALGSGTINYGVYAKITGGSAANNPPTTTGAGSYAGYFYEGFPGTIYSAGAAFFNGAVITTTPGVISVSDKKFKKDVSQLDGLLDQIMMLEPKSYQFISEKEFPSFSFPEGKQYGFIAQEIEKVFPELVSERVNPAQYNDDGTLIAEKVTFKGVEYAELIPILTAGIQEQQKMIEEKDAKINDLEERITRLEGIMNEHGTDIGNTGKSGTGSQAILFQNTPNPFNGSTVIRYRLPETYTHADVMIFDMNGKKIQSIPLHDTEGQVMVSGSELVAGMYLYSLVLDGQEVATKRMVVTK